MAEAGYHVIGGTQDFDGANDGQINGPYTVGVGATITEAYMYLTASGTTALVRILIYEDSGGEPGALISTCPEISVADGAAPAWVGNTGLSLVTSVSDIWVGFWVNNNAHRYYYDTPGGNPGRYKSVLAAYSSVGDAPDPWPAGSDSTTTQKQSAYVVYTPAAPASGPVVAWITA